MQLSWFKITSLPIELSQVFIIGTEILESGKIFIHPPAPCPVSLKLGSASILALSTTLMKYTRFIPKTVPFVLCSSANR